MKWILWFAFTLPLSFAFASAKSADPMKPLKDTLSRIQKVRITEFTIERKVVSELTGKEKVQEGYVYLSKSLFRLETKKPMKTLVVFDGKTIWSVNYPDPELGGPIEVLRGKLEGKQKDQLVLTQLLSQGKLLQSFNIKKTGEEDGTVSYEALPKEKTSNLQSLKIQVQAKTLKLKLLEYVDDVGNKTSFLIREQKLQKDPRPELFKYTPEKGAQVTDI